MWHKRAGVATLSHSFYYNLKHCLRELAVSLGLGVAQSERENLVTRAVRQLGGAPGAVSLTVAVLPTRESEARLASVGNPGQIETSLILSPHYQRIILPTCTRMFDIFSPGSRWEYLQVLRI